MEKESIKSIYNKFKSNYGKDVILLFRSGDLYKCFNDDAVEVSNVLGITLEKLDGVLEHTAMFPFHALDDYLVKLIKAGYRVAISDIGLSEGETGEY